MKNFLPKQYMEDKKLRIKHNYLSEQFRNYKSILKQIEKVIRFNDYTLGKKVDEFEDKLKKIFNEKYIVSVGSGTDAIMLSLKCLGIKEGDEVITTPYTFYATIGAIVTAGGKPVFVDVNNDYNINAKEVEKKITKRTKAIIPVHWSGRVCDMDVINRISKKYNIPIVEDSCHAILASYKNKMAGTFGEFGCFSMHPLKNLNIWGDGGFVIIKKKKNYRKMLLMRNHGLINRNVNTIFGYNSRLDTIQAVVAINALKKIKTITVKRIKNAEFLDRCLSQIKSVITTPRSKYKKEVFHIYEFRVNKKNIRDALSKFLIKNGIDAKIHYPIPMHLQPAAKYLKYKKGSFPVSENIANTTISLPVHEFISNDQLKFTISKIKNFFHES